MSSAPPLRPLIRAVNLVRNRPGARRYRYTSEAVRGGNILYSWLWAWLTRREGMDAVVQASSHTAAWTAMFPLLEELTTSRQPRIHDRRVMSGFWAFDHDFTAAANAEFCRALVESSGEFRGRRGALAGAITPETIVVNVRRGDYYSVPEFRARYAIDIPRHVREGLTLLREPGESQPDVLVISDDVPWCRENLGAAIGAFRTLENRADMFDDLAALTLSRRLVLANSTFSYWGSYIAKALDAEHRAIAPPFHERTAAGHDRLMFDARWDRTTSGDIE